MIKNEIWKPHPEFKWVEVSTWGQIRTVDRYIIGKGDSRRFLKGHILKQRRNDGGYLYVNIPVNGKWIDKRVHRLIAQTFLPNPDNLPQVNHKDCDPTNNNIDNLEWCTASYNIRYREKHGKAIGRPLWAVNVKTQEKLQFSSQHEAGRKLGINNQSINMVIKGKMNQAGGYFFTEDESEITKERLNKIKSNMPYKGGVIAVNSETQEVLYFKSQSEATNQLKLNCGDVTHVIKGQQKTAHSFWFTKIDENAIEATRKKFGNIIATRVGTLITQVRK